jgi:apolipoprotein N-acyltransferase
MSGALTIMKIYNLEMSDPQDHNAIRVLGLLNTIPLILMVLLDWKWKKVYDERDRLIERKSLYYGIIGAFVFLAGAGWFLTVYTKMGSIKAVLIIPLVYLACFVMFFAQSSAALVQYGWGSKGEKK